MPNKNKSNRVTGASPNKSRWLTLSAANDAAEAPLAANLVLVKVPVPAALLDGVGGLVEDVGMGREGEQCGRGEGDVGEGGDHIGSFWECAGRLETGVLRG